MSEGARLRPGRDLAKRRMARLLVVLVALLAAVGLLPAPPTAGQANFSDVPASHPRRADILQAVREGWFQGYPDGTFRPDQRITAGQIGTVVSRAFPSGSTRADMASFMVGGDQRAAANGPLVERPETVGGYDRDSWSVRWPSSVNQALRWRTGSCKWAYYSASNSDCGGNVHRDHLVAVKEAYDSGGSGWGQAERRRFYVDTDNLYVMPGSENIRKSASDPAEWKPGPQAAHCRYAQEWIAIKTKWSLAADRTERAALRDMLGSCSAPPDTGNPDATTAVRRGWFTGYPDGTFRPGQAITARQITAVVSRAYPNGATRAELASFMVGGTGRLASTR